MLRLRTHLAPSIAFALLTLVVCGIDACGRASTDVSSLPPPPPPPVAPPPPPTVPPEPPRDTTPIGPIVVCPPDSGITGPLAALGGYQLALLNGQALPQLVLGSGTPAYGNELDDALLVLRPDSTYDMHGDGATNGVGDTTMVQDHGVYSQCGSTLHFYSQTKRLIPLSAQLTGGAISMSLPAPFMDRFENASDPPYLLLFTTIP
ncbi:MAG TPA: hypothetical protein VK617_13385, partial [Gemmatimonadaceae bacterium]|nr:hypothetical protein [Gemmatimonadaceae bacterium]